MMYEVIISLILIALFAFTTFTYINANTDSNDFFSKVYAIDIATTADLVNAPYGDVVLRYDNLKTTLNLGFWLSEGRIAISEATDTKTEPMSSNEEFFGKPKQYVAEKEYYEKPVYFVLRKNNALFSISEAETTLKTCSFVESKSIKKTDAKVYLEIKNAIIEGTSAEIKTVLSQALANVAIPTTDKKEDATITVTLELKNSDKNYITFMPTSEDGQSIACLYHAQLKTLTLIPFETNTPSRQGKGIVLTITLETAQDVTITNKQIGLALANAIAVYYR